MMFVQAKYPQPAIPTAMPAMMAERKVFVFKYIVFGVILIFSGAKVVKIGQLSYLRAKYIYLLPE